VLIKRVGRTLIHSCVMLVAVTAAASAQPMQSLAGIAHAYGYEYVRLNPEMAVELVRPGLDVVIKPGTRLFWVNGSLDATDVPPAYVNRDVYVSAAMAHKLAMLARAPKHDGGTRAADPQAPTSAPGGPVTVGVIGGVGAEAVDVFGSAPPHASVRVSLFAKISDDLPTVTLSSATAVAGSEGKYSVSVPLAPDFVRGSVVTVQAATDAGATATATYVVGAPNPTFTPAPADPPGKS